MRISASGYRVAKARNRIWLRLPLLTMGSGDHSMLIMPNTTISTAQAR